MLFRSHEVLMQQFIASHAKPPKELVLDVDATHVPLHGEQERGHTIGEDHPRPGTSVFHAMLIVVDHVDGSVSIADIARPAGPRNCGQVVSGATGASGTKVVMNRTTATKRFTRESYNGCRARQGRQHGRSCRSSPQATTYAA